MTLIFLKRLSLWPIPLFALFAAFGFMAAVQADAAEQGWTAEYSDEVATAVVQILAIQRDPSYLNPWTSSPDNKNTGSGIIISGKRILTNAHVVANQKYIAVKKASDPEWYRARVMYVGHEEDLALITVDDDLFYSGITPLETGDLPSTGEKVLLYGFPGSDSLTMTEGLFSGAGYRQYTHSSRILPAGEIRSDVRVGSSGGPVIYNDRVAGIVMQATTSGRIAHMIPAVVIDHFLKDVDDGVNDGFPDIGLITSNPEGPGKGAGLAVSHVVTGSPAEGHIMEGDILISINDRLIDSDGTVEIAPGMRTDYNYSFEMSQINDRVDIGLRRSGVWMNVSFRLTKGKKDFQLVPGEQYDAKPRYLIFGGIIFSPLTKNIFNEWKSPPEEFLKQLSAWPTADRKELVVALMVLPSEVNRAYHGLHSRLIEKVNNIVIRDFDSFVDAVTSAENELVVFRDAAGGDIVIDAGKARQSHSQILETYSIKYDRSPDLMPRHAGRYPSFYSYQ